LLRRVKGEGQFVVMVMESGQAERAVWAFDFREAFTVIEHAFPFPNASSLLALNTFHRLLRASKYNPPFQNEIL
jgi:hypothetical protein